MKEMPDHIKLYISEIAQRLSHGRAIAMVGAGFSKNAEKARATNKRFLNWNELGDIFYEKVYAKKPDQHTGHYLDALKLASMVENMFGRPALDQLLQEYLPDEEYEPSRLHKKLLELNWADVFTTNYDTLLERAGKCISNKRYQPVVNIEDLVYAQPPRIVKLHGSFPHSRPFIISQEDYRKYPSVFAAFVNTVQQAIIENTLCLFGFSGDDPNFLNWIGWIRDNLGAYKTSKIYMITADPKLMFEKTFLAARNIIVVNMAECFDDGKIDYGAALESFLDHLLKDQRSVWQKDWAEGLKYKKHCWKSLPQVWRSWQKKYPGWIILPGTNRGHFEKSLKLFTVKWLQEIDKNADARKWFSVQDIGLYEWVRQLCLLPLTKEISDVYRKILEEKASISQAADLAISLLTYYRQNGCFQEFTDLKERLDISGELTSGQNRRLLCEKAYFALYGCEYMHLDQCLSEWPDIQYDCTFELMHIKLLWEAEQYKQGLKSLVTLLNTVRAEENGAVDLCILSQEAYLLHLMKHIPQTKKLSDSKEQYWYEGSNDYGGYDRLNYIQSYGCDPENEIELFKVALSGNNAVILESYCYKLSAQFINFYERIGLGCVIDPDSDTNEYIKKAISCIIRHNLYWGMALSVQTWDTQFMQKAILAGTICASGKETNRIAEHLRGQLLRQMDAIRANKEMDYKEHRYLVWEEYIPDMLSALLMKSSERVKENAFAVIKKMQKIPDAFLKLHTFALQNLFYSFDGNYLRAHIEELLRFILYLGCDANEKKAMPYDLCDFMLYDWAGVHINLAQILPDSAKDGAIPEADTSRHRGYVQALLYCICQVGGQGALDIDKGLDGVVENSAGYPLDYYFFVHDRIENESEEVKNEMRKKVKERIKEELKNLIANYRIEDDEKLLFTIPRMQKIIRIDRQYKIDWTRKEAEDILRMFFGAKKAERMSSQRRSFLLGNLYPFFLNVLWEQETDWKKTEPVFYCDLTAGIGNKKDAGARQRILSGIYCAEPERFIITASIFYQYLKEDVDQWKGYLPEIQAVLITKIQSLKEEAPFCLEMLGLLMHLNAQASEQIRKEPLSEVLQMLLKLHTDSYFRLLIKAYGAKLASDIYRASDKIKELDPVLESWKELCTNQNGQIEHTLVRKQWAIVTDNVLR